MLHLEETGWINCQHLGNHNLNNKLLIFCFLVNKALLSRCLQITLIVGTKMVLVKWENKRNNLKHSKVLKNTQKYSKTLTNTRKYLNTLKNIKKQSKILKHTQKHSRILKNIQKYSKNTQIYSKILKTLKTLKNTQEHLKHSKTLKEHSKDNQKTLGIYVTYLITYKFVKH